MTKTQRALIEEIIRKAERGPSLGWRGGKMTTEEAERNARIWAESWIADPLRALLSNVDGDTSAAQLARHV